MQILFEKWHPPAPYPTPTLPPPHPKARQIIEKFHHWFTSSCFPKVHPLPSATSYHYVLIRLSSSDTKLFPIGSLLLQLRQLSMVNEDTHPTSSKPPLISPRHHFYIQFELVLPKRSGWARGARTFALWVFEAKHFSSFDECRANVLPFCHCKDFP